MDVFISHAYPQAPNGQSLSVDNSFEVENIDLVNVADDETGKFMFSNHDSYFKHHLISKQRQIFLISLIPEPASPKTPSYFGSDDSS